MTWQPGTLSIPEHLVARRTETYLYDKERDKSQPILWIVNKDIFSKVGFPDLNRWKKI
jgi:hypothetical protein